MDDVEKRSLLKDEYLHIQGVIQAFDDRALTIKGWSVTFSMVALIGAFVSHAPIALLVASLSACFFWMIEANWKTVQDAHYERAGKIERYFAGAREELAPMQVGASWYQMYHAGGLKRRILQIACEPSVAMPHALIFLAGFIVYALYLVRVIQL